MVLLSPFTFNFSTISTILTKKMICRRLQKKSNHKIFQKQLIRSYSDLTIRQEDNVKYRVFIEQDKDGVFVAEVPALPGCISQGSTRKEALQNIQEAITVYVESLKALNEPIPPSIHEEVVEVVV